MMQYFKKLFTKDYGIALGGGGARGAAHIGAVRAINEAKLPIKYISGTSSGSVIAALIAFGIKPENILGRLQQAKALEWTSIIFKGPGFFKNDAVERIINDLLPAGALIEQSQIPLAIHTTDVVTGKGVSLTKGSLMQAVLASCAVPGIYVPINWEQYMLADGGITENVPLTALNELGALKRIGINLNGASEYSTPQSVLDVITNAMDIAIDSKTKKQMKDADIPISLQLSHLSRTNSSDFYKLIDEGYEQTKKQIQLYL